MRCACRCANAKAHSQALTEPHRHPAHLLHIDCYSTALLPLHVFWLQLQAAEISEFHLVLGCKSAVQQPQGAVTAQVLGRPQRKWLDDTLDAVQEAPVKLIVSGSVVFGSPLSNDTDGPCSGALICHWSGQSGWRSFMSAHGLSVGTRCVCTG